MKSRSSIRSFVFVACLVLVLTGYGCAATVRINGMAVPREQLQLVNPQHGIIAVCQAVQFIEESENSVSWYFPKITELAELDEKTKSIELQVRVINPKKHRYLFEKKIIFENGEAGKVIYEGRAEDKIFQIPGPLDRFNEAIVIRAVISSADGESLIELGDVAYVVRQKQMSAALSHAMER
mgnify:CR=1 FL=1